MRGQRMFAFWASFGIIAAAELGDKSQLLALAFASRFRAATVLLGVFLATLLVHAFSVLIGDVIGIALPTDIVLIVAGLSFIGFGLWSIRGDAFEGDVSSRSRFGAVATVAFAFFIAELGDKTQFATISLATQYQQPVSVWIGSTLGMVVADALAIGTGSLLGRRLPHRLIGYAAALVFFVFGGVSIAMGIGGLR